MRCVIIEDEKAGQTLITKKLNKHFPEIKINAIIDNKDEAIRYLSSNKVDFIFLDMHLKKGTGIDVINALPSQEFESIIVTAHKDYAIEAINLGATYYLLKPFSDDDFIQGVSKMIERLKSTNKIDNIIYISKGKALVAIKIEDIFYMEADGTYTKIYTNTETHIASKSIGQLESLLKYSRFIRSHHSYIVNINKIKMILKNRNGVVVLKNGTKVPISQRKMQEVLNVMNLV